MADFGGRLMTKMAWTRDDILSQEERDEAARRALSIIEEADEEERSLLGPRSLEFLAGMRRRLATSHPNVTERQLAWLRDIAEKLTL